MTDPRKWTRALAMALLLRPGPALADWQRVTGEALMPLLIGLDVVYADVGWDRHEPDGRLLTRTMEGNGGRTRLGQWYVPGDMRCLRWERDAGWDCYIVEVDGEGGVRFTDSRGNHSTGELVERDAP